MAFEPMPEGADEFTEDDWLEAVAEAGPSDTFSNGNGEATIPVYIKQATEGRLRSALTYVLGYAYCDEGSPYKLHRVTPVGHPLWGWAYRAQSVQFSRFNPLANPDNANNEPNKTSLITGTEGGIGRYANYGQCWMTVRFAPRKDYLYEDDSAEWSGFEYDRYTETTRESSLEVLMSDAGGVLYWAETGTGGPTVGNAFPGQIGELLQKNQIQLLWKEVPLAFTHDGQKATKIENIIGHVNSTEFLGYPAGTLLCQPPKFDKKQFPFYSEDGRAFYHDILFTFSHFDPTPGASSPLFRGHNLMPWRGGNSSGSGPGWYAAYRTNSTSGKKYLPEADFAKAFEHVLKP